ncbi:Rap1a/Tai family immunity protein [Paraburkholderia bonniea]|uniref:Rap1a/Tai family immunity protein n=1 Tax=Paraburkholderia bonniea TaxID=2152891 RepID=UPI0025736C13|nr:Rap1a/Tai family immunity protein [Paraburkholderia bonniea]WJF92061.1 Rap1a/Tai family immunity protein [Paraburkholderia bonniea]WJF95381.1 Rap1a/Tai family immunity protein [Paraburkholderia bonniea]
MKLFSSTLALSAALLSGGVAAQSIEQAATFYNACSQPANLDLCAIFLAGYTGGVNVQSVVSRQPALYCMPPGTTHKKKLETVLSYLNTVPAEQTQPTATLVYKAFAKAWPCR